MQPMPISSVSPLPEYPRFNRWMIPTMNYNIVHISCRCKYGYMSQYRNLLAEMCHKYGFTLNHKQTADGKTIILISASKTLGETSEDIAYEADIIARKFINSFSILLEDCHEGCIAWHTRITPVTHTSELI